MERRRVVALAAAGIAIAGGAAVAVWQLGGRGGAAATSGGASVGAAFGAAGQALAAGAPGLRGPLRCSGDDEGETRLHVGARTYQRTGNVLRGGSDDRRIVIGVVADARGADDATLANARWAAGEFSKADVDVVVVLGGMGADSAELERVLGALAAPGWLLVAMPGDREPREQLRAAVTALRAHGLAVADGTRLAMVVVDGVAIGLVPGLAVTADDHAPMLIAGADGCGHDQDELDALVALLAAEPGPHLVASYAPPRQRGEDATDLALGGIHVGEPALTDVAEKTGAAASFHGWVDECAGRVARAGAGVVAACGALGATPVAVHDGSLVTGSALVVVVDNGKVRVRVVRPPLRPAPR